MFLRTHPDFLFLWLAQIFSQAGTRMYQIAIVWWIISLDEGASGWNLGIFMLLGALPALLFVKQIGAIIDRYFTSKRILITSDLAAAGLTALITLALYNGWLNMPLVFLSGFLIAICQGFIDPTLNKAVPELMEPKDVETGVAFISSTLSIANFGGAVLGALLIDVVGITGVVLLNVLSYAFSGLCASFIRFRYAKAPKRAEAAVKSEQDDWNVLRGAPLLTMVLIGFGLINFFSMPTLIILPLYTKNILGESASFLGILEASLWVGIIVGTFVTRFLRFFENTLWLGGVCLATMGICLALPGLIQNGVLYAVFLFMAGLALGINNVRFVTLLPNKHRFRTMDSQSWQHAV